jgi:aubergine-like protein
MEKSIDNIQFNKRKNIQNQSGDLLQMSTNYFRFKIDTNCQSFFYKYSVEFVPELPGDSVSTRRFIWRQIRDQVDKALGFTLFNNTMCYSHILSNDVHEFTGKANDQTYTIFIKIACEVKVHNPESLGLFKRFVDSIVRPMKYIAFRKNLFDPKQSKMVNGYEIWPGFNYTISSFGSTSLLNLNMIHRVLRNETAFEELMKIRNNCKQLNSDELMKEEIKQYFKGAIVLTRYNNDKTYIIDDVDFDLTPQSTFSTKEGAISFMDYYVKKYSRKIVDPHQPLLVHIDKKNQNKIYLVPELCFLTGLTDEMRANFNLMKSIATVTKPPAEVKLKEGITLVNSLLNSEKGKENALKWQMTIDPTPVDLSGRRLPAGNILMKTGSFDALAEDIDRKVQQPMLNQPSLQDIKVLVNSRDFSLAGAFMDNLQAACSTFKYDMKRPEIIQINSMNLKDWEDAIRNKTTRHTMMVVLILPGGKGKGTHYNELKRLLKTDIPIPSQVILTSTLKRDKGLRSVVNKVLIQICAKVGGETWSIDNLPFTNQPTMVVGIDIYFKKNTYFVGCAASCNRNFTQFFTVIKEAQEVGIIGAIKEAIYETIEMVILYITLVHKVQWSTLKALNSNKRWHSAN